MGSFQVNFFAADERVSGFGSFFFWLFLFMLVLFNWYQFQYEVDDEGDRTYGSLNNNLITEINHCWMVSPKSA
jgi:hypothetical protein